MPFALEVVSTGSSRLVLSWVTIERSRSFRAFIHNLSDKAFIIPCWISLVPIVPTTGFLKLLQYLTLLVLILAETTTGGLATRAYYTGNTTRATDEMWLLDDRKMNKRNTVTTDTIVTVTTVDHAKQTLERVGVALYMIPWTRYLGVLVLVAAVPLAYESVRRQMRPRVFYVHYPHPPHTSSNFDHNMVRFWMQVKAMGCTKLIVGVPVGGNSSSSSSIEKSRMSKRVLNACSCSAVDLVIAEAPLKADLLFLEKQGIDYCVVDSSTRQDKFVTDEIIHSRRFLEIGPDGRMRLVAMRVKEI
jgi:glycerol-3-phosphate cytidylyltransferase-like family protein